MRSNRWMLPPTHKYSASVGLVGGWTQWGRWMCPTSRLDTTLNDGYLGLVIDEGRSEVRQVSCRFPRADKFLNANGGRQNGHVLQSVVVHTHHPFYIHNRYVQDRDLRLR